MTKRIFRSIALTAMTVLLTAVLLIVGLLNSYFESVQFEQLRVEATLASHAVANEGIAYFEALDNTLDCRITWIAADGTVLYDNRSDSGTMENHLAREEVVEALRSGYGQSDRHSDTLMEQYLYAAERLPDGTVLRLSVARRSSLNLLLGMLWPLLLVIAMAVALSVFLAGRLSRSIVQPLNSLNLNDIHPEVGYEEIHPLLLRMESQQKQLREQAQELAQRQKEFNTVTRSLSEGLILISASGTILSINSAAAELLQVTPNCAGADFSVANRNAAISALVDKAMAGEKAEQTIELASGDFLVTASPVKTDGVISGVVLFLMDVTQKQQAEQLRREFTANVSHELKTPLHAISGYAELLKSGMVAQADSVSFAEKIYAEAQRMGHLVEDTLRLSRLDEGAEDMEWCACDLYETALQTLQSLKAPAELAQVNLELTGESAPLWGIPQLLSGILFNLTDNAVKYNRPGGSVTVRVENGREGPRLTVADTGIGIPAEHRERIFERFYRVDKSHSKEVGGTGLGLSIVKHAALILKAELNLTSTPGRGTTVTVQFPPPDTAQ